MTAHGSLDVTIEAIKRGAFYYIEKPFTPEQASVLAARALQFKAVKSENRALKGALAGDGEDFGLVGNDPKMRQIREVIRTMERDQSIVVEEDALLIEVLATGMAAPPRPRSPRPPPATA